MRSKSNACQERNDYKWCFSFGAKCQESICSRVIVLSTYALQRGSSFP
jgi:hypothetical protein